MTKVIYINTIGFVLITKYDTDKTDLNTSALVRKTGYNFKIAVIKGKIHSISGLVANAGLTSVENKIPSVRNLVKKTDYNSKITEIENKCITTAEYNKFIKDIVDNSIEMKNLITNSDFDAKLQELVNE